MLVKGNGHAKERRGILNVSDVAAYAGMVLVAFLLFLLFLFIAHGLKERAVDEEANALFSSRSGQPSLHAYLRTRADAPPSVFGAPSTLPGADATMAELIIEATTEESCLAWLAANGAYGEKDPYGLAAPPGCAPLFYRSVAFFRALCGDDYVLQLRRGTSTVRIGNDILGTVKEPARDHVKKVIEDLLADPGSTQRSALPFLASFRPLPEHFMTRSASFLSGTQTLPAEDGLIIIQFVCVERYGVSVP